MHYDNSIKRIHQQRIHHLIQDRSDHNYELYFNWGFRSLYKLIIMRKFEDLKDLEVKKRLKFHELPEVLKSTARAKALHVGFKESELPNIYFKVVDFKIVAFSDEISKDYYKK